MKTVSQIKQYLSKCRFSNEDWQIVRAYCKEHFNCKVSRSRNPESPISTPDMFIDWLENGYGAGDIIMYRQTPAMVGYSIPGHFVIAAYFSLENFTPVSELVFRKIEVGDRFRKTITPADAESANRLRTAIYNKGLRFNMRLVEFCKLYNPEKKTLVTAENVHTGDRYTGIYLGTSDGFHSMAAIDKNGKYKSEERFDVNDYILSLTEKGEERKHQKMLAKRGEYFNPRMHALLPASPNGRDGVYWYLNDRFVIVQDKDNGSAKHKQRCDVGNYFIDYHKALIFMSMIRKIRKEGD